LAPYRRASGIGVSFPLGPEADLQNAGIAFQGRFLYPLIVAILTIMIWVVAALFIHAFAAGLGGVGSFNDYLKLVAYVVALWLLLLPLNLAAAILRFAGFDQVRDAVGSVFVLLGLCLFAYQIVLAAVAVRVHYRVSSMRALGAMSLTLTTATLIASILKRRSHRGCIAPATVRRVAKPDQLTQPSPSARWERGEYSKTAWPCPKRP
jgi:hypothetical protein